MNATLFFQILINGVMSGGAYALVAAGLTLTLSVVKILNFAQGDFLMLGAYATFAITVTLGLPYPIAVLISLAIMIILGVLLYLGILERALRFGFFNALIVTVLLVTVIEQISVMTFAQQTRAMPPVLPGNINMAGVIFSKGKLLVIGSSITVLAGMYFFMKSKTGKAMTAAAENSEVAALQGINAKKIFLIAMALACGLSGIAGAIIAPVYGAYVTMGTMIFTRALLVILIGGMGSMGGALIGALLLGVVESFAFQFVGYLNLIVILAMTAILLFIRPGGLLGKPLPLPGE